MLSWMDGDTYSYDRDRLREDKLVVANEGSYGAGIKNTG